MILDRDRSIVNNDQLVSLIRKNGIKTCRISSKFIDIDPVEIQKSESKENFLTEIQKIIFEHAKHLPHHQVVLKITKEDTVVEIMINPVPGAA